MFFLKFGNYLVIIFSSRFSASLFLSYCSDTPIMFSIGWLNGVLKSYRLSSLFLIFFFLCSDRVISNDFPSRSLILLLDSMLLSLSSAFLKFSYCTLQLQNFSLVLSYSFSVDILILFICYLRVLSSCLCSL